MLDYKRAELLRILKAYGRVGVAYSGGVDSAVVAKAAQLACGENTVAITAVSPSLASGELEQAQETARLIGIRHQLIRTHEIDSIGYRANAGDRCFYCKDELYSQIETNWDELEIDVLCNGANVDDQGDHRPGMTAARQHAVRSPLIEAGINKQEVRELAKLWDLPVWDKPASPCLSSRIAYGIEVTAERLKRIDAAEAFLKTELELRELRVRCEANELARIEVTADSLPAVVEQHAAINQRLLDLGFRYVSVDLGGLQSGSMNKSLPVVALQIQDYMKSE